MKVAFASLLFASVAAATHGFQRYPLRPSGSRNPDIVDDGSERFLSSDSSDSGSGSGSGSSSGDGGMGDASSAVPEEWSLGEEDWSPFEGQLDCNLYRKVSARGGMIEFREVLDPIEHTVTVEMVYAGHGYVSVSLASTGHMVDNIAVIGLPDEPIGPNNPGKYELTSHGDSGVNLLPADKQTLMNGHIEQNETHTLMRFTQHLQEDGEREILASPDVNKVVYATGKRNGLGMHKHDGAFSLMLTYCLKPDQDPSLIVSSQVSHLSSSKKSNKNLWLAHGLLMAVAMGVLVPLAIGTSLLRNSLPLSEGAWFKLHRGLNLAAITFIALGFVLALAASGGEGWEDGGHPLYGWIVVFLFVLQTLSGFFRPSNKAQPKEQDPQQQQSKPMIRTLWEVQHRYMGFGLLMFAWFTVATGLAIYKDRYGGGEGLGAFFWITAIAIAAVVAVMFVKDRFFGSKSEHVPPPKAPHDDDVVELTGPHDNVVDSYEVKDSAVIA